ncbi:MAG: Flp pilus assembly complex ATPase component TadA [Victivallaceae bacterium]|nr:Flp pilus assembly complex ATPase component TadA [Victivallaceae bacterium]
MTDTEYILTLLKENGMVDAETVRAARAEAEEAADRGEEITALDVLIKKQLVDENEMLAMLATQYGVEMMDLSEYEIPDEVKQSLSVDVIRHYGVVPVMNHDGILTIAMSDPTDMETLDTIRYLYGGEVDAVVAPKAQIQRIIDSSFQEDVGTMDDDSKPDEDWELVDQALEQQSGGGGKEDDETPIIRLVSKLIIDAYKMRASDIHFEPMGKKYRVRYRIDGALREIPGPPKYLQANFTSRIKIMSHMDITEHRIPLDGRIQMSVGNKDIDLRVSSIPTIFGESIVMRILDKSSIQLDIPKLGFYADDMDLVTKIINYPDGIFLVTGPTGSGKTTSLYAFLNSINSPARKLITVEDPVEYQLQGINQVQVDRYVDMTFAAALRSMLRQAPNIIMIGEIRDLETAEIAINASLTGHLVFSTLHTNDAPGAITRLIDMGVKPFLVATSLRAVMAQRLLRRICPNCKHPVEPTEFEKKTLGLSDEYLAGRQFYKGEGCKECGFTGYKGRIGIYEIFVITEDIGKLIFDNETSGTIREYARRNGMRSLRDDALRKAEAGVATLEDVIMVTLRDEA